MLLAERQGEERAKKFATFSGLRSSKNTALMWWPILPALQECGSQFRISAPFEALQSCRNSEPVRGDPLDTPSIAHGKSSAGIEMQELIQPFDGGRVQFRGVLGISHRFSNRQSAPITALRSTFAKYDHSGRF